MRGLCLVLYSWYYTLGITLQFIIVYGNALENIPDKFIFNWLNRWHSIRL